MVDHFAGGERSSPVPLFEPVGTSSLEHAAEPGHDLVGEERVNVFPVQVPVVVEVGKPFGPHVVHELDQGARDAPLVRVLVLSDDERGSEGVVVSFVRGGADTPAEPAHPFVSFVVEHGDEMDRVEFPDVSRIDSTDVVGVGRVLEVRRLEPADDDR